MANRPAKNISSLASQTIVPTLTMFGRVRECTREVSKVLLATGAVVTRSSWHRDSRPTTWGTWAWRTRSGHLRGVRHVAFPPLRLRALGSRG
ncbi:hypothetical protein GCM10023328_38080 [Modestobacter marinus]|uniref:Uncharacterized protein n=1 Tax=Modestobacter marinus TaxID=477641 RepID=A0ABQ2G5J3_9ACTN|nr:hypothetical protein GCM10011589_34770 [Modestobacter marinus]